MKTAITLAVSLFLVLAGAAEAGTPAQKCRAAKLKATAGRAAGMLKCHTKAAGTGLAVETECLTKVSGKFVDKIASIQEKGGCDNTDDGSAVEATVDAFIADVLAAVPDFKIRRVFITSTTYDGNLGGLIGADAKCQARADAATLGGTWTAWLSTNTVDAKDRLTDARYLATDGVTIIANSKADLIDGGIPANIRLDESGATTSDRNVWTGTLGNGTKTPPYMSFPNFNCSGWTVNSNSSPNIATIGTNHDSSTAGVWTYYGASQCSLTASLYCFEQ